MIAVRRSSPGRMRNPASNARSNLPGMAWLHTSKTRERSEQTHCASLSLRVAKANEVGVEVGGSRS